MATRLTSLKPIALPAGLDPKAWARTGADALAWRPPRGEAGKVFLWRTATVPYWLSSDVPRPHLPARDHPALAGGPAGDHVIRHLNGLTRRIWLQRVMTILVRSLWLPLIVACGWMVLEILGGPAFRTPALVALAGVLLLFGTIFALLSRPTRRQVARMLDRSFDLQDRVVTAIDYLGQDVPQPGERARVTYLQMADAANVVTELRGHPAFRIRPPVREIVLGIAMGLLLAALFFLRGAGGTIPAASAAAVPKFVPAAELMARATEPNINPQAANGNAPTVEEIQEQAERSNQSQRDLQTLAKALQDQAVTSQAAAAIQRGDYAAAANALHDVAENADQISPEAREGLANDLDQAASEMSGSPNLAQAAEQAAEGLREGGEPAQQGMDELADEVQETGEQVMSQSELSSQLQEATAADRHSDQSQDSNGDQSESNQNGEEQGSQEQPSENGGQQEGDGQGSNAENGEGGQEGAPQPGDEGGGESDRGRGNNEPGQGSQGDASAQSPPGEEGQGDQSSSEPGNPGDSEMSSSGDGAGTGESQKGDPNASSDAASENQQPGQGEVSEPNVTDAPGAANGDQTDGSTVDPREAISLSSSKDGESVKTGNDSSSAAPGQGAGAFLAGGNAVQGEVGEAGPDSNRVPPSYRSVVEAYFSDPLES